MGCTEPKAKIFGNRVTAHFACNGGAFNQWWCLVAGSAIAAHIGAQQVVLMRSVGVRVSNMRDVQQISGPPVNGSSNHRRFEEVFDYKHFSQTLQTFGITLNFTDEIPLDSLGTRVSSGGARDLCFIMTCENVQQVLLKRIQSTSSKRLPATAFTPIVIDLGNAGWGIDMHGDPVADALARALHPAPHIRNIAHCMIQDLRADRRPYNGVHLRVEDDQANGWIARPDIWAKLYPAGLWGLYFAAAGQMGFRNSSLNVFAATGGASPKELADTFASHFSSRMLTSRELCLPMQPQFAALSLDQKALVDALVLAKAERVVGFPHSSMSFGVKQMMKTGRNQNRQSFAFIDPGHVLDFTGPHFGGLSLSEAADKCMSI